MQPASPRSPRKALITSSFPGSELGARPGDRVACHPCLLGAWTGTQGQPVAPPGEAGLWFPVTIPVVWRTPDRGILQVSTSPFSSVEQADQSPLGLDFCWSLWEMPESPGLGANQAPQILLPWASGHPASLKALSLSHNVPIPFLSPPTPPSPARRLPCPGLPSRGEADRLGGCRPVTKHSGLGVPGGACSLCSSPRPGGSGSEKRVFRARRPDKISRDK